VVCLVFIKIWEISEKSGNYQPAVSVGFTRGYSEKWCPGAESNRRHEDFQATPTVEKWTTSPRNLRCRLEPTVDTSSGGTNSFYRLMFMFSIVY